MSLPTSAINEDHRLEKASERTSEELARHRWHWTLDESNPKRVGIKEYARAVGVQSGTVSKYAHGYSAYEGCGYTTPLVECIERAGMTAETEAVTEAVSKARGQTFAYTRRQRATEIRHVREEARERAEANGTSIEVEAPKVARAIVRREQAEVEATTQRRDKRGLAYLKLEHRLLSIRGDLLKAHQEAGENLNASEREALLDTINRLRDVLNLVYARIAGTKTLDWQHELDKILEGV